MTTWSNWSGHVSTEALVLHPTSTPEVQSAILASRRVKAVGAGHSFTPIAVTDGTLLSLETMNTVLGHDPATHQIRVQAGISLHRLNRELLTRGLALPNLGDVDPQSLAGATSTGTHGTGRQFRGLADAIVAVQLVTAGGDILEIDAQHPWFNAVRLGLGALGVITEFTVQCVPAFLLHAREYPLALGEVLERLDELVNTTDHFEFYWFPHTEKTLVKQNTRLPSDADRSPVPGWRYRLDDVFLSNVLFERVQRLVTRAPSLVKGINTVSGSLLGAREYVDYSHEVFVSPRWVRFREMEFALPRESVREALTALQAWFTRSGERVSFPIEVRFAAADDMWLSTGYQRENVYIAVHQFHRQDPTRYFAAAQDIFMGFAGRPHWGKEHSLTAADFARTYPRFADFLAIREELDPERRLTNPYLQHILGV